MSVTKLPKRTELLSAYKDAAETKVQRIKALNAQAAVLSKEVVTDALAALSDLAEDLEELSGLAGSIKAGVRDRARQLAETLRSEGQAIQILEDKPGT